MKKIIKKKSTNHPAALNTKLLDKISDSVFLVSLHGDIVYVNKTAYQSLGYTRDELMKTPLRVLDGAGKADKIRTRIKGYIKKGSDVFETAHLRKDKSVMPVELNVSVIRLDKRIFVLGVARDITERKKKEQEIRESEQRYRQLVELSPYGIVIHIQGRIIFINNAGVELLGGKTSRDIIGKKVMDFVHLDDRKLVEKHLRMMEKERRVMPIAEEKVVRLDGRTVTVEVAAASYAFQDKIWMQTILHNITERKEMEEKMQTHQKKLQLLNSQLLETEEKERRRLATELHDNIGQKLAFLKIKLGTIRQSEPPQNVLEQLDECGKVFEEIIQDTRSLTFQLIPPLLHQIGLNAAVEWLAEKIHKEHGLEFELEKSEKKYSLDEKLRFLLYRCIQELLTNVVKHGQAHKVDLSIRQEGDLIKIRVEDDGIGFDSHALCSSGKSEGFGLFSIRERLSNIGGLFKVDSAPGRGTRVSLVIPVDHDGWPA